MHLRCPLAQESPSFVALVNATAATSGGALTILTDFLAEASSSSTPLHYVVFASPKVLNQVSGPNITVVPVTNSSWLKRAVWDWFGMRNWCRKQGVCPQLAISFQNIAMNVPGGCEQVVYLHQSLPFATHYRWSLFKREHWIFWFYRHVYLCLIWFSLLVWRPRVAVQTSWMKAAVCRRFQYSEALVDVVPPAVKLPIGYGSARSSQNSGRLCQLFYPAVPYEYKNHEVLLHSLSYLKVNAPDVFSKLQLCVTAYPDQTKYSRAMAQLAESLDVANAVLWMGVISREECFSAYCSATALVFPSIIETVGLPLVEAASCGCPVIAADLSYAREVLAGYAGVCFVDSKRAEHWAEAIKSIVLQRPTFEPIRVQGNGWKGFVQRLEGIARGTIGVL